MSEGVSIEVIAERQKVANHRIDNLEAKVEDLTDFKYTVNALSETVKDLKTSVDKINSKDGETYNSIRMVIITSTIGSIIGFILGQLF